MTPSESDFKQAIASYGFPRSEPIHYLDLNGRPSDPSYVRDASLYIFRSAGPEGGWHNSIEAFWASALFNFLEDSVRDQSFEQLGTLGEYRAISKVEASRLLIDLIGTAKNDYITVPVDPTSCFVVYSFTKLKAFVGTDATGYFAVIWKSWSRK